jgi:hypothetical protein
MPLIYHPETQATVMVPAESVNHYRLSGWVLPEEWDEHIRLRNQAAEPAQETADEVVPARQPRKADKETK